MHSLKFQRLFICSLFLLSVMACSQQKKLQNTNKLSDLQTMMSGSFDSSLQAKEDSSYYDISLEMVPVWKNKTGYWLYVEQAVSVAKNKPYRQRMYKLEQLGENKFVSKVYTLKNPDNFIGKWESPDFFDQYDSSILEEREGCGVFLSRQGNQLVGSTNNKDCKSTLRGASYATSKVTILEDRIESWDQGFNAADEQVWGATKAGYVFIKK